jgi:hypothetical protein
MRLARGLSLDDAGDGAVRVRACDWPWAAWLAVPPLLAGLPLVAWSAATSHWIELSGGVVFLAFGALAASLAAARRRDVVVSATSVKGREGAGPFARGVEVAWSGAARLDVRPFARPEGAPDLAASGGDLVVVVAAGAEFPLARRTGPGWRETLESARAHVVARIPVLGLHSARQEAP